MSNPFPSYHGPTVPPIAGLTRTQLGRHWDGSTAVDIAADLGTPLRAIVSGMARVAVFPLGGNTVTITGDNGITYYYAHLQHPGVSGRVNAGQQIGQVGETGNAAGRGPHLHLGISSSGNVNAAGAGNINAVSYLRTVIENAASQIGSAIPGGGSQEPPPGAVPSQGIDPTALGVTSGIDLGATIGAAIGQGLGGLAKNSIGSGGWINQHLPAIMVGLLGLTVVIVALVGLGAQTLIKVNMPKLPTPSMPTITRRARSNTEAATRPMGTIRPITEARNVRST